MAINLSTEDESNFIELLKSALVYGSKTDHFVEVFSKYFPTKSDFESSVPVLSEIGKKALSIEDRDILDRS